MEYKKETQNKQIWKMLNDGWSLTSLRAFYDLRCTRLAARIFDLRKKHGHDSIITKRHPDGYAVYSLNKDKTQS